MSEETAPMTKDEKVLGRARKRWKMAEEAESENRLKEADDIRFLASSPDDNYQWPADVLLLRTNKTQEGGARPCLTINKLPQHHRQVTNEQRMNRPQIKVRPVDDLADPEVAKIFDGVIRHIQVASEADLAYDNACDWQVGAGEGFLRILTEYCDEKSFDQDAVIAPIADRFKVYMDPIGLLHHPAGRKCKWGFIVEDVPKDDYEAEHGDEHPIDWTEAGIGDQLDWFPNKETVRVAEYFEIDEKPVKLFLWANGQTSLEGEPLPEGVTAVEKPKKERKTKVPVCIWRKLNGQHVLSEQEMPTKYIPIIRVVGNQWIVEGKPIVSGIVRNAKDAQRMYNYNASMEVELNALAPKAPFVAMAEQIKGHEDMWRNANRVSYSVLTYNAVVDEATNQIVNIAPPARAQPQMPQAAVIAAKLAAADDIKSTTGQYDPSLGNNPQAKSGIALQREQVKSEVGTFHYVDNLARALRYAGAILVDMIPRIYSGKRIARILGEDGEPDHVVLDDSIGVASQDVYAQDDVQQQKSIGKVYNLGVGKYDVVVTTGPSFTTKRQEAAEFLTNVIGSAKDPAMATVLTYLALKSNDWAGAEEATEMVKKLLPPGLLPAEGEDDQETIIATPKGPMPASQVPALIAEMGAQLEQAAQALKASGDGQKALEDAKRIMADVQSKAAAIQAREQIIGKTLEAEQAKDEAARTKIVSELRLMVERSVAGLERMKIADVQAKEGEDAGVTAKRQAEAQVRNDAIAAQQAELTEALRGAMALLAAPRRIDLVTDEAGMPVGAVSAPAPIEGMTV